MKIFWFEASGRPLGGNFLTIFQILDTFTFFGVDIVFLATLTTIAVQILKKTLFKNAQKKILTFMPFAIGTFLYAIFSAVKNLDIFFVFQNYVFIMEHGFSVGVLATLLYVLYEQFVRKNDSLSTTEGIISTLIEAYVPLSSLTAVSKEIAAAIEKDVTGSGAKKACEIILANTDKELSETDLNLLSKLIIETLAHLNN